MIDGEKSEKLDRSNSTLTNSDDPAGSLLESRGKTTEDTQQTITGDVPHSAATNTVNMVLDTDDTQNAPPQHSKPPAEVRNGPQHPPKDGRQRLDEALNQHNKHSSYAGTDGEAAGNDQVTIERSHLPLVPTSLKPTPAPAGYATKKSTARGTTKASVTGSPISTIPKSTINSATISVQKTSSNDFNENNLAVMTIGKDSVENTSLPVSSGKNSAQNDSSVAQTFQPCPLIPVNTNTDMDSNPVVRDSAASSSRVENMELEPASLNSHTTQTMETPSQTLTTVVGNSAHLDSGTRPVVPGKKSPQNGKGLLSAVPENPLQNPDDTASDVSKNLTRSASSTPAFGENSGAQNRSQSDMENDAATSSAVNATVTNPTQSVHANFTVKNDVQTEKSPAQETAGAFTTNGTYSVEMGAMAKTSTLAPSTPQTISESAIVKTHAETVVEGAIAKNTSQTSVASAITKNSSLAVPRKPKYTAAESSVPSSANAPSQMTAGANRKVAADAVSNSVPTGSTLNSVASSAVSNPIGMNSIGPAASSDVAVAVNVDNSMKDAASTVSGPSRSHVSDEFSGTKVNRFSPDGNTSAQTVTAPVHADPPDEHLEWEEEIREKRLPLVEKYEPYISPSDQSLQMARERLRTALDQVRLLRAAFTERVYGKYRVCLRPPPTTQAILDKIMLDPIGVSQKLQKEIHELREEKEIEKREAQTRNADIAANTPDAAAMNADNAEQLMYISAGLSLVILPEEEVDAAEIDMKCYKDRGPINPETGQRVRSISQAAAAAGEVILDRARKSGALREERQRRHQLQRLSGEDPTKDADTTYPQLHTFSSSALASAPAPASIPDRDSNPAIVATAITDSASRTALPSSAKIAATAPTATAAAGTAILSSKIAVLPTNASASANVATRAPVTPHVDTTSLFTAPVPKAFKKTGTSKISPSSAAQTNKGGRPRGSTGMSLNLLLSLNPNAERINAEEKPCPSTAALIARGVGSSANNRSTQQRLRHPHPDSLGGRQRALDPASAKKELATLAQNTVNPFPQSSASLALPPVPTPKERFERRPLSVLPIEQASTKRARKALQSILAQFGAGVQDNGHARTRREITKIGLLHGIQKLSNERNETLSHLGTAGISSNLVCTTSTVDSAAVDSPDARPIDPALAFSVLQAVGLVKSNEKQLGRSDSEKCIPDIEKVFSRNKGDEEKVLPSFQKLGTLWTELFSRRRRLTESFVSGTVCPEKQNDEDCKQARKRQRLNLSEESNINGDVAVESPHAKMDSSPENLPDAAPLASIRGGGGILLDPPEDGSSPEQQSDAEERKGPQPSQPNVPRNGGLSRQADMPQAPHAHALEADLQRRLLWEDQSHSLAMLNSHLAANQTTLASSHVGGQASASTVRMAERQTPPTDTYHHQSTINALHLAHQLRHATSGMPHAQQRPGGFDWPLGSASLQMAAAHSSLVSLELARQNAAIYSAQQDRARALLAREQQSVAAAAAAAAVHQRSLNSSGAFLNGSGNQPFAQATPFPRANTHAALLNSSSQAAVMGHTPVPVQAVAPSARSVSAVRASPSNDSRQSVRTSSATETAKEKIKEKPKEKAKDKTKENSKEKHKEKTTDIDEKTLDRRPEPIPSLPVNVPTSVKSKNSQKRKALEPISEGDVTGFLPDDDKAEVATATKRRKRSSSGEGIHQGSGVPNKNSNKPAASKAISNKQAQVSPLQVMAEELSKTGVSDKEMLHVEEDPKPDLPVEGAPKPSPSPTKTNATTSGKPQSSISQKIGNLASSTSGAKRGMQIFLPPSPPSLTQETSELIRTARIHDVLSSGEPNSNGAAIVEYLISVGASVPIPKGLILIPLKERLNASGLKNPISSCGQNLSREVIVSSILIWLWTNNEETFQSAFAKSGRIDVDPDCKWLIQAAIDSSARALALEINDALSRAGITAPQSRGGKAISTFKGTSSGSGTHHVLNSSVKLDLITASIVSKALMTGLCIDDEIDFAIPQFHDLVQFLDESRLCALHSKSQERVLLASLLSRTVTMSESFSNAYVSSMVRASEALGHDELSNVVMDEDLIVSTMLPYDVFKDETGVWEDPARPSGCFTEHQTGDVLMRRAHARAVIQKSLKKLQERNNIKAGTPVSGPYSDNANAQSSAGAVGSSGSGSNSKSMHGVGNAFASPRGAWAKRKLSSFAEPAVQAGTGSAPATSWTVYDPKHFSVPLAWNPDDLANRPYGVYKFGERARSLSFSQERKPKIGKKGKRSSSESFKSFRSTDARPGSFLSPSTLEIPWSDVAGVFQKVRLPGGPQAKQKPAEAPSSKTIISPFVRQLEGSPIASDEESEGDEDLRDEIILAAHQGVLDRMKDKISEFLETRKKQLERRKKSG